MITIKLPEDKSKMKIPCMQCGKNLLEVGFMVGSAWICNKIASIDLKSKGSSRTLNC